MYSFGSTYIYHVILIIDFRPLDGGIELAKQIIDEFYQALAMGLYNLTFTLNPEKILIGGAISHRSEIYTAIKQKFQKISM